MAELSDGDRESLWADFMHEVSNENGELGSLTKSDLRSAVNALDTWLNTNAATINLAITQPARSALTTSQKARLLMFVVRKRYLKGV